MENLRAGVGAGGSAVGLRVAAVAVLHTGGDGAAGGGCLAGSLRGGGGQRRLPATVDRPQFVVQKGPNRVAVDEFNRWAAPLASSIARTVAENLVVLLGTPQVVSGPLAPSFDPAYRVTVDIQRFESVPGEAAMLDALWQVRRVGADADAGATIGRTTLREPAQEEGYDALAAAHSRAIAGMSRDIAAAIRAEAGR
jgi:uncharacterized lipoprotein YmbA